jgi:para-nitrobenzyl esterase
MVWIYGGGRVNGSSAESFFDGNAIPKKGVVVVRMNYRVNIFGWFAHPELTRESPNTPPATMARSINSPL